MSRSRLRRLREGLEPFARENKHTPSQDRTDLFSVGSGPCWSYRPCGLLGCRVRSSVCRAFCVIYLPCMSFSCRSSPQHFSSSSDVDCRRGTSLRDFAMYCAPSHLWLRSIPNYMIRPCICCDWDISRYASFSMHIVSVGYACQLTVILHKRSFWPSQRGLSHYVRNHESQVVHFSVVRWMTSEIAFATTRSACTDGCSSSNLRNALSARCGTHSAECARTRGNCPGLDQSRPCRLQDRLSSHSVRRRMHVRPRSR